jgi:hypothetical protein
LHFHNQSFYSGQTRAATVFQEQQSKIEGLIDSMVLMKPSYVFKAERDLHANSLLKRGIHRVKDIKHSRVVPD